MAMKLSKKKRPKREEKQMKGETRIEAEVFDRNTLLTLNSLIERKVIGSVEGLVSRGKEANIFLAKKGEEFFAVKIYRVQTGAFQNVQAYIQGDPRFEGTKRSRSALAYVFAKKEFSNLKQANKAGVMCLVPVKFVRNILITKFLGENGLRYPKLSEIGSESPEKDLDSILLEIKKLYSAGLVHSDISEYNILMCAGTPYLIDFAQAVTLKHPNAGQFLERDVSNILRFFEKKYGIQKDKEKVLKWIGA